MHGDKEGEYLKALEGVEGHSPYPHACLIFQPLICDEKGGFSHLIKRQECMRLSEHVSNARFPVNYSGKEIPSG